MNSKIIQISTTSTDEYDYVITALCKDGTVWSKCGHNGEWMIE